MKVTVIGADGQLGSDIAEVYRSRGHTVSTLNHDLVDIRDHEGCLRHIAAVGPDLVINTAAMHHVESCEDDPSSAFAVNALGARNLALMSARLDFTLVHFSTDYVFDGSSATPYTEDDCPLPLNVYGNSKLAGENFIRTLARRFFIVRVSGLFGRAPCRAKGGLNFVQLMRKLAVERETVRVVDNEVLSPTHTLDVAEQLEKLTRTDRYGLFHMVSRGSCSWYEFAEKIFEFSCLRVDLRIAGPGEFPSRVRRPAYSVLDNRRLREAGMDQMPHWTDALRRYIALSG